MPPVTPVKSGIPELGADGKPKTDSEKKIEAEIRRLKLKINGEEREFDEPEVVRLAQKGFGADEKFREASTLRKQAEAFFQLLKTNPVAALTHPAIGHDVRKMAEDILFNQIQYEKMSPEQKELYHAKLKLKQLEDEKRRVADEEDNKKRSSLENEYRQNLQKKIMQALDSSGLPKTSRTVARVAHYMFEARTRGFRAQPEDVLDMVKTDYQRDFQDMFGALPGDAILKVIGDETRKRIREAELNSLKNPSLPVPKDGQPTPKEDENKPKKIMTSQEFRERNRKIMAAEE
jgi:hypothetical protein